MNLQNLIAWTIHEKDLTSLHKKIKKEGDINICHNLLGEVKNRAQMAIEKTRQIERYMCDITEYLITLKKRGIIVPEDIFPIISPILPPNPSEQNKKKDT